MQHVPIHVVNRALPDQVGYTLRTHQMARAQREIGMRPSVVVRPLTGFVQCQEFRRGGIGVNYIDGVPYYRLSEPRVWRRWYIRLSQRAVRLRLRGSSRFGRTTLRLPDNPWDKLVGGLNGVLADATVVHAHTPYLGTEYGLRIARLLKVPFVYEIRGFWELSAISEDYDMVCGVAMEEFAEREAALARSADRVTTLGDAMKDELVRRGVDSEKIRVVGNGVDTAKYTPTRDKDRELLNALGLQGRFVLGYVTSVRKLEGVDVLLEALHKLLAAGIPASVLLVGDGPELPRLQALADSLGVAGETRFTGKVPFSDVCRYYSLMDVFVVPRTDAKVCQLVTPLKPLEAMAMAKPVVVSDLPALREFVDPGVTGTTFRPNDPDSLAEVVSELYKNPSRAESLGQNARRWITQERHWHALARTTQAIYDEILPR